MWRGAPPLATARVGAGVAALGGTVFVTGGESITGQLLTSVEMLDPHNQTWSPAPPMLNVSGGTPGRYLHVVVAMSGFLWSIGGSNRMTALDNFCYYSGGTHGLWHGPGVVPQLPTARVYHGAAAFSVYGTDNIMVVGGYIGDDDWSNNVAIFNYDAYYWSSGKDLIVARKFPAVASDGIGTNGASFVYVVGGVNETGVLSGMEIYATLAGSWALGEPVPSPLAATAFGVLPQPARCNPNDVGKCNVCETCCQSPSLCRALFSIESLPRCCDPDVH